MKHRRGTLRHLPTYHRIWLKSVIIPSLLILCIFAGAGWWAIDSLRTFYYEERFEEATLTAESYSRTIGLAVDAQRRLEWEIASILRVTTAVMQRSPHLFTEALLIDLVADLDIDFITIYDRDLQVVASSRPLPPLLDLVPQFSHIHGEGPLLFGEVQIGSATYMWALAHLPDGSAVQVGIQADLINQHYGSFTPQHIIDELGRHNRKIRLALLDADARIIAATDASKTRSIVEDINTIIPADTSAYRIVRFEGASHLAYYLPLPAAEGPSPSLAVLFDLTDMNRVIRWVAIAISLVLLLIYLLFLHAFYTTWRLNRQILHLATHDELTGLGNLRLFNQVIHTLEKDDCALMVINPLNFKHVNMLYGYAYGDEVLTKLGASLARRAQERPHWSAYRLSDDRFLLLIGGSFDHALLTETATAIIGESLACGLMAHPALTIGITERRGTPSHQAGLLKQALIALNSTSSDNPIQFYTTDLEAHLVRTEAIEQLLKRALDGQEGLLSLCFQPICECSSGRIVAFEALARLTDEDLGTIAPEHFIPIAERRQLITPLAMALLPKAFALIEGLRERAIDEVRVAINVSALQLFDDTFMNFLMASLDEHGIDASSIELELTESAFAADEAGLTDRLQRLRSHGIRISIDDFGSGYSSLSRLRSLQFDTLKLGRPFIQQIEGTEHTHLFSDIISMAHHLGKRVVAEGVETEEQRAYLSSITCDLLQGYLLGKPLTLQEAIERATVGHCHG